MKLRQAKKIIKRTGGLIAFHFFKKPCGELVFLKPPSEVKAIIYLFRHVIRFKKSLRISYLETKFKKKMKFKVTYIAKDGDCCSVWTEARTITEAKANVRSEYHDVREIINITKFNP